MSVPAVNTIINSTYNSYGPLWNRPTLNSVDLCNVPWSGRTMYRAFHSCTALKAVYNMNTNVTNMAFTYCDCHALETTPGIPSGVTSIDHMYCNCYALETIPTIPSGVTNMSYALARVRKMITSPTIPSSVTDITGCFTGCTNLTTTPTIPNSITNMYRTFDGCTKLQSVDSLPSSVSDMSMTFNGCSSLTQVVNIPTNVTNTANAFAGCTSLAGNLNILSNKITDASNMFAGTTATKSVYLYFYSSGTTKTQTYNALLAAGYGTSTFQHGVHLLDKAKSYNTLEIDAYPPESEITLTASGYSQFGNTITVPTGTNVHVEVIADNYDPYDGYIVVSSDIVRTIILNPEALSKVDVTGYTYTYDPDNGEVLTLTKYTGSATSVSTPQKEAV